jgi:hypothetical protein
MTSDLRWKRPPNPPRQKVRLDARRGTFVTVSLVALCFAGSSCASAGPSQPLERPLPAYRGPAAELFDDAIAPSAVGFEFGGGPRAATPAMTDRAQTADAVIRARVVTLTSNPMASGPSWQIGLRTREIVAGQRAPDADFMLLVKAGDPAAGVLRAAEEHLVGTTFIVFVRTFAASGAGENEPVRGLHFHVVRDSPDEINAIRAAAVLGEVR